MDLAIQQPSKKSATLRKNTLFLAVACSLSLHILLVVMLPSIQFDSAKKPELLKVELVRPAQPKPAPEPIAKTTEPIKPLQPVKQKPVPKPASIKPIANTPIIQPASVDEQPTAQLPPAKIITAIPNPDSKPSFTAPATLPKSAPEPPKAVVSQDEINEAKNAYITSVQKELQRNHRYPKMAERNGIQGIAKVEIKLDKLGNIISATIVESSGSNLLDDGALATVKRSNLKQFMQEILYGHFDTLVVPIAFTLTLN